MYLEPLERALPARRTPAQEMIEAYERTGEIPFPQVAVPTGGQP
jgi:hypothetical protein